MDELESPLPFSGKVVAITGGARGIGLATARYLAERGASLSIADVLKEDLVAAEEAIARDFPQANVVHAVVDVASETSVADWIASTIETFGKLDCAVNNAGIVGPVGKPLTELTDAEFDSVLAVNVRGVFHCLREELKVIEEGGSIVNLSSVAGLYGFAGLSPYVASKHAVLGLTRCAAKEAGPRNVRVNAVCPGAIGTAMMDEINEETANGFTPEKVPQIFKRHGQPEEIAALIGYLLGDESKFTTMASYVIDGGWGA